MSGVNNLNNYTFMTKTDIIVFSENMFAFQQKQLFCAVLGTKDVFKHV